MEGTTQEDAVSNNPTSNPEHTFKVALDTSKAAAGAGKNGPAPTGTATDAEKRRAETAKAAAGGERPSPEMPDNGPDKAPTV
jgi:hypothetical protein